MCPPTATAPKKQKININKKKKSKERQHAQKKKKAKHGYFCPLSNLIFSHQFSLHFGKKTFWRAQGENT